MFWRRFSFAATVVVNLAFNEVITRAKHASKLT